MKKQLKLAILAFSLLFFHAGIIQAQSPFSASSANYPLKFRYLKGQELRDTILGKLKLTMMPTADDEPLYLKWKSQPFALNRLAGQSLSLETDSASSFAIGQTIGILYYKQGAGSFRESNLNLFVKEGENPNTEPALNANGDVVMKARTAIGSNAPLLIDKTALRTLTDGH